MMPYSIAFSLRRNITLIRAPVRPTERSSGVRELVGARRSYKKSRRQESAGALFVHQTRQTRHSALRLLFLPVRHDTTRTACGTGHLVWTGNPDASEGSQSHDHVVVARIERGEGPQLLFVGVSRAVCVCVCVCDVCGCVTIHSVRVCGFV